MDGGHLTTSRGGRGGEHLGLRSILVTAQCCQRGCTCVCLPRGTCGNHSTIVVEVLHVRDVFKLFHCKQPRCVVHFVGLRCQRDHGGVKVDCKSVDDFIDEVVMAELHINLLGQCFCVRGILLVLPLGQCRGLHSLHLLGMLSKLSALSKVRLVELDHPLDHNLLVFCQGVGGDITHQIRGTPLRGALRGHKPAWRTQEGG
jgi:hypothetical protein